jgi:hypothetical protein
MKITFFKPIFGIVIILIVLSGCEKNDLWNYDVQTIISFEDIPSNNIVVIDQGVTSYNLKVKVTSSVKIQSFSLYEADPKTGLQSASPIIGTNVIFKVPQNDYSVNYNVSNIVSDRCIKAVAVDYNGNIFKNGVVIQLLPQVIFTQNSVMESYDYLWGTFFANWYNGLVYSMRHVTDWISKVDISSGMVNGTMSFVSPAAREGLGLPSLAGVRQSKFMLTSLTKVAFDAVKLTDKSSLQGFNPTYSFVQIVKGKVFAIETADGNKGLIFVSNLTSAKDINLPNQTVWTVTFDTKIATK